MGIPVLILGESGTGKSASLRNFKPSELKVINVANKPLPFKNKIESVATDDYRTIVKELKLNKKKVAVIDDAQYLMANEFMRRATERGFDKFTEIAQNFWSLVNMVKDLPSDQVVYFLAHIERDANGNEKIKTIGKLLDEKITVEGMFTIVLKTNVTDGVYSFITQNSGHDTVKSPIGMFPSVVIDNDLKYVDEKIRNYYEIGEFLTDDEIAEIDEAAKKDDIPIEDGKKKRGRRSAKKEEPEDTSAKETEEEKPKRSRKRRTEENIDNGNESVDSESDNVTDQGEPAETEEKTKRRRKSREAVSEDDSGTVSEGEDKSVKKSRNARRRQKAEEEFAKNAPAEDEDTEIPFDEVDEVADEPKEMTGAKKAFERARKKTDAEEADEKPATRRRRRRA